MRRGCGRRRSVRRRRGRWARRRCCCRRRRRSGTWRCRGWRWRRSWTWRCRCRRWWCGSGRRRRCGGGRRRARWRRGARRLLGPSVWTDFLPGLGHDKRRVLRMRDRSDQLHRRKSGRGKQQQADVCHDGLNLRTVSGNEAGDQRIDVRPDCGGPQRRIRVYFLTPKLPLRDCSLRIQAILRIAASHLCPAPPSWRPERDRDQHVISRHFRPLPALATAAALVAAAHRAFCRAALPAVAARLALAPEAARLA